MLQQTIGITLQTLGIIFIAFLVLQTHSRLLKQQQFVDETVLKAMKFEQLLGVVGIIFIVFGYVLMIISTDF